MSRATSVPCGPQSIKWCREENGMEIMSDHLTWLPSELADEMGPMPRKSPDDWVTSLDDGAPALDNDSDGIDRPSRLSDGQIVKFISLTDHGRATLIIRSDTDWTAAPPMPTEAIGLRHGRMADRNRLQLTRRLRAISDGARAGWSRRVRAVLP